MRHAGVAHTATLLLACLATAVGATEPNETMTTGDDPIPFKEEDRAISYAGIGLSRVSTTFQNVSEAVNLDVAIGLRLPVIPLVSAEIDGSFTIMPGSYRGPRRCTTREPTPPSLTDPDGDPGGTECEPGIFTRSENEFQMTNVGLFAAVRTPGRLFLVGKYGYRLINSSIPEIQDGDDRTGTAWTGGAGWRWDDGLVGMELAYTKYSGQIDYLGLNLAYGFGASPGRGAN